MKENEIKIVLSVSLSELKEINNCVIDRLGVLYRFVGRYASLDGSLRESIARLQRVHTQLEGNLEIHEPRDVAEVSTGDIGPVRGQGRMMDEDEP